MGLENEWNAERKNALIERKNRLEVESGEFDLVKGKGHCRLNQDQPVGGPDKNHTETKHQSPDGPGRSDN